VGRNAASERIEIQKKKSGGGYLVSSPLLCRLAFRNLFNGLSEFSLEQPDDFDAQIWRRRYHFAGHAIVERLVRSPQRFR
jgi:hypothetical protein